MPRTIEQTPQFRQDFDRETGRSHSAGKGRDLRFAVWALVAKLAADRALDIWHYDRPSPGAWADYRDCQVWPDIAMIYRKPRDNLLQLVRLGYPTDLGLGRAEHLF